METIILESTRKGHPAIWECGGSLTHGYKTVGNARIIAGENGEKISALFVPLYQHRKPFDNHVLFPVKKGLIIIDVDYKDSAFTIEIKRIERVVLTEPDDAPDTWVADLKTLHIFEYGDWDTLPTMEFEPAIHAAKEKALCYQCNEPYYYAGVMENVR